MGNVVVLPFLLHAIGIITHQIHIHTRVIIVSAHSKAEKVQVALFQIAHLQAVLKTTLERLTQD